MKKIIIYTRDNCSNCKATKVNFEKLTDVEIIEMSADTNKEEVSKYAPKSQWSLPLCVFAEDNMIINVTVGIQTEDSVRVSFSPFLELNGLQNVARRTKDTLTNQLKLEEGNIAFIETCLGFRERNIPLETEKPQEAPKEPEILQEVNPPEICDSCQ